MKAEIIAIGSELLLGETVDTNSAYLARQLAGAGVSIYRKATVGDNRARVAGMIREALERADLVICTGGLGPTVDDITREAVADALGVELVFHQHLLDQIAARFAAFGRTMSPSNRRQAFVPAGARIIENPRGTAPAFITESDEGTVVVLPGVPSEMRFLFETAVLPYLRDVRGVTTVILVRTLHAVGLGESVIGEMIADLMEQENPTLGISAKRARYELRLGARAERREEAEAMLDAAEAIIRERLGPHLVGDQPLDHEVAEMLKARNLSLALYEGTIEAPLFRTLNATPSGRESICGVMIHPLDRPADDQAALSLAIAGASAANDRWRSDLALGLQADYEPAADGFSQVAVVLIHANGSLNQVRRIDLREAEGWGFAATMALELLRRFLLENEY